MAVAPDRIAIFDAKDIDVLDEAIENACAQVTKASKYSTAKKSVRCHCPQCETQTVPQVLTNMGNELRQSVIAKVKQHTQVVEPEYPTCHPTIMEPVDALLEEEVKNSRAELKELVAKVTEARQEVPALHEQYLDQALQFKKKKAVSVYVFLNMYKASIHFLFQ